MTNDTGWNLLVNAIADAYIREAEGGPGEVEDYPLSPRYRRWEKRYIYKKKAQSSHKLGRCIASVMIAFLLAFAMVMTVEATRQPFIDFITQFVDEWLIIKPGSRSEGAPEIIECAYLPDYIPSGYKREDQDVYSTFAVTKWKDANGQTIVLTQSVWSVEVSVKSESTTEIQLAEQQVLYHSADNYASYDWHTEEYQFGIIVYGELSQTEVEKIIASIK